MFEVLVASWLTFCMNICVPQHFAGWEGAQSQEGLQEGLRWANTTKMSNDHQNGQAMSFTALFFAFSSPDTISSPMEP